MNRYSTQSVPFRITKQTRAVLTALLEAEEPLWGLGVCEQTGLVHGTVSPILTRLRSHGWTTTIEERDPHPGRPPRIYHHLTPTGRARTEAALAPQVPRPDRAEPPAGTGGGTHVVRVIVTGAGSGTRARSIAIRILEQCPQPDLRITVDGANVSPRR